MSGKHRDPENRRRKRDLIGEILAAKKNPNKTQGRDVRNASDQEIRDKFDRKRGEGRS